MTVRLTSRAVPGRSSCISAFAVLSDGAYLHLVVGPADPRSGFLDMINLPIADIALIELDEDGGGL